MKKIIRLIILGCMMFSLSGCGSSADKMKEDTPYQSESESAADSTDIEAISIPDSYIKEINGIQFNISEVETDDTLNLSQIKKSKITRIKPESEKIETYFSNGKKLEKEESDSSIDEEGKECLSYMAWYEDGSYLYSYNSMITWITEFSDKIHYSFRDDNTDAYSSKELSFKTPNECLNLLCSELEALGYSVGEYQDRIYSLDYETLKDQELHEEKVGEKLDIHSEWSESDECYAIYLMQKHNGIPLYCGNELFGDDQDITAWPVNGLISKDGVVALNVQAVYAFTDIDECWAPIAFEECTEAIAEKYGNILYDADYVVNRAKLYYVAVKNQGDGYTLHLAWLFQIEETGDDPDIGHFEHTLYTLIDAETGEEITL